jgi:uncharacterized protein (TIGR02001 family)
MLKRTCFAAGLLLSAGSAGADELRGEFRVTSNYVWRGFSLSEDAPAVIGGIEYRHEKGWFGTAHAANVRVDGNPEQQAVLRAGLRRPIGNLQWDAGVNVYEYLRGDRFSATTGTLNPGSANKDDFVELFLGVSLGNGEFRYHRSEDYLGSNQLSNYYEFNYAIPAAKDAKLILHYGFTDSAAIVDHVSQLSDMAFGIAKGPFSLVITNLDDNEDGLQSRNPRVVISWYQGIDF